MDRTLKRIAVTVSRDDDSSASKMQKQSHVFDGILLYKLSQKSGLTFTDCNGPSELNVPATTFTTRFEKELRCHSEFPKVLDVLEEDLKKMFNVKSCLRWCMLPCKFIDGVEDRGMPETTVRLLLSIGPLQFKLGSILLDLLAESCNTGVDMSPENDNLPMMIIGQLRWIDRIEESEKWTKSLVDVMALLNPSTLRDLILVLPEVIDDAQHAAITDKLRRFILDGKQLIPSLDAISSLNVSAEVTEELKTLVIKKLKSAKPQDLPVMLRYVLQASHTPEECRQTASDIRNTVDFECIVDAEATLPVDGMETKKNKDGKDRRVESVLGDILKTQIAYKKPLADAFIQCIAVVMSSDDYKMLDFLMLIIIRDCNYQKPVDSLVRNKIRAGAFNDRLLQHTFSVLSEVLKEYITTVLALAHVLLKSAEHIIELFGAAMYRWAFEYFGQFCQQQIIGNLVFHVGSGIDSEIDSSLNVLLELGKSDKKSAALVKHVKSLLDYLDMLNASQMRKVYAFLSDLAFDLKAPNKALQDELHMMVKKQLSSTLLKIKRMGVIGGIMVVQHIARANGKVSKRAATYDEFDGQCKQVIALLQQLRCNCNHNDAVSALCIDELSAILTCNTLEINIQNWLTDNAISDFQEHYLVDWTADIAEGVCGVPTTVQYALDPPNDSSIVLNLQPLVLKDLERGANNREFNRIITALSIPATMRLIQMCERLQSGSLSGIDAVLGCGILLPKDEVIEGLANYGSKEKILVCNSLFIALNWLREVINAFSDQEEIEMKGKVVLRLKHITDIHNAILRCLAVTPNYKPPLAYFDSDDPVKPITAAAPEKKIKKKKEPKTKAAIDTSTVNESIVESLCGTPLNSQKSQESAGSSSTPGSSQACLIVDPTKWHRHLRELDMVVFLSLASGPMTRRSTNLPTQRTASTLETPQLVFLLEDLVNKLSHRLIAFSASKRKCFLKSADTQYGYTLIEGLSQEAVVTKTVKLSSAISQHLKNIKLYFQELIQTNDGIMDAPVMFTPENQLKARAYTLLLNVFVCLLTWEGFRLPTHKELLHEILLSLRCLADGAQNTNVDLEMADLLKEALRNCMSLGTTILDLNTAVMLCRLMACIVDLLELRMLSNTEDICEMCKGFLKRQWVGSDGQPLAGSNYNSQLKTLISMMLDYSEDKLAAMENLTTAAFTELMEGTEGVSTTFPTLTKHSYNIYHQAVWNTLVAFAKDIGNKSDKNELSGPEKIQAWARSVQVFNMLVNLLKVFEARQNLGVVLKNGRLFMELFLRLAMPLIDQFFRVEREKILGMLKKLQLGTRVMQHLCGHSKIVKDVALTRQVPRVKMLLESFVYRVKACMTVNNCLEAFWLGNLKNRDLQGEEIIQEDIPFLSTQVEVRDTRMDEEVASEEEDAQSDVVLESDEEELQNADNNSVSSEVF